MRVAVIGPGAVGTLFGGYLMAGGLEVVFIGRPGRRVDTLRSDGLRIQGPRGELQLRAQVATDSTGIGAVDAVLLTVKAYDTRAAVAGHRGLMGPHAPVISLQNGLGNLETIAEVLGDAAAVLAASTTMGGYLDDAGVLRHVGEGDTFLGEPRGGISGRVRDICAAFAGAGVAVTPAVNIRETLAVKAAVNCVINPLTALLRAPNGALAERAELHGLMRSLLLEAAAVANAEGLNLNSEQLFERTLQVARRTARNRSSMLRDVEAGRRTEIEAINGAWRRLGERRRLPTPLNAALEALILALRLEERA